MLGEIQSTLAVKVRDNSRDLRIAKRFSSINFINIMRGETESETEYILSGQDRVVSLEFLIDRQGFRARRKLSERAFCRNFCLARLIYLSRLYF